MDSGQILYDFMHVKALPEAALRAATDQRAEMTPLFLREIENYLAAPKPDPGLELWNPLLFIFFLLGQWRETSAYKPLARLLRSPPDDIEALFGDGIVESGQRVMAAVFDGDPQPLYDIILDQGADEYVRSRMCEALGMLVLDGRVPHGEARRFLQDAFTRILPRRDNFTWNGWQSAIAMLADVSLKPLVKQAFDEGVVDKMWMGFEHFEKDLDFCIRNPGQPPGRGSKEFTLFDDAIEELSHWHCFSEKFLQEQQQEREARKDWKPGQGLDFLHDPFINPYRDAGRNDPCPCGSGMKFKKCCLI